MLENHTHFLPHAVKLPVGHVRQVFTLKEDLSIAGLFQTVQTAEKCTLTRTRRPDDDYLFALFDVCGNVFQNMEISKGFVQMFNLDHFSPISFPVLSPENSRS